MKWSNVKLPYERGGLGVRTLIEMNMALQRKWIWRYLNEENYLWRRVVEVRWGLWGEV